MKLVFSLIATMVLLSCADTANSCDIPKFVKKGETYQINAGLAFSGKTIILDIDKGSCWISVETPRNESTWVNLRQVISIVVVKEK
ncbi:MAG: hypothetical protein OEY10_08620 [Nitrosopumilus sp.]|nr:hypothetical protein [Nitrosopumilus sp.]MDH5727394.1 hypothetical protein [Gammaproteobacteria bacterium]